MTTPVQIVLFASKNITLVFILIFGSLVIINFLYALQIEHASARQKLMDDQWLLEKCGEPDFYMRLKQHTDLCESVEANPRQNILLQCAKNALQKTQLCGFASFESIAVKLVDTLMKLVDTLMKGCVFMLACFIVLLIVVPCVYPTTRDRSRVDTVGVACG